MDLESVFSTCGQSAGLEVWRVENFKLAPVHKNCQGQFYVGDCYIILHTVLEPVKKQNLHFWIGSESTNDEYGSAAIITTQMDTALNDLPVQFREVEGNESATFRSYFKKQGGLTYKAGGNASGFTHAETNYDAEDRLLRIKGKRKNIMAREVPLSWDSVTNDDVFIFEIGPDLYRWRAPNANMFEWMQSSILCNSIRDNEQGGRGRIWDLRGDEPFPKAITKVLGEAPEEFPASEQSDAEFSAEKMEASLYKVSMDSGSMQTTKVFPDGSGARKIPRSLMENDDCYILDLGNTGTIFVWKGSSALASEKKESMANAAAFIEKNNYSKNTSIEVYPEGSESEMFRQYFNWNN